MGLAAGGALLTGFMLAKAKMKLEMDMKLHVKAKLGTKVLLAVAWSQVGCSASRQRDSRATSLVRLP